MKQVAFLLFLLVSTSASAEWTVVDRAESAYLYVDFATIRKQGYLVKMWVLYDFKTSQRVGNMSFLSDKSQEEFDCQEQLHRPLTSMWFERNMGDGRVVHILSEPGMWQPVAPETVAATFLKIACKQ